jgi:hypothetical protein
MVDSQEPSESEMNTKCFPTLQKCYEMMEENRTLHKLKSAIKFALNNSSLVYREGMKGFVYEAKVIPIDTIKRILKENE